MVRRLKKRKSRRPPVIGLRVLDLPPLQMKMGMMLLTKPEKKVAASHAPDSNLRWYTNVKMRSSRKSKRLPMPQRMKRRRIVGNLRAVRRAEPIVVKMMKKIRSLLNSHQLMRSTVLGIGDDPRRKKSSSLWKL
jgi:hypothetical protein